MPLWILAGVIDDDIEALTKWAFNEARAEAGYTVKVEAADGFSKTFESKAIAYSEDYLVANKINGSPLADGGPLRLVGAGVVKADGSLGGSAVGSIAKITVPELLTPEPAPGSWNLVLNGKIGDVISQAEFENGLACPSSGHLVQWTDKDGNVWTSGGSLRCSRASRAPR